MQRNKVYGCLTKNFFTKSADAKVFLPLVSAFHAAGMLFPTVYVKQFDQYTVFVGQKFSPLCSKKINFSRTFLVKVYLLTPQQLSINLFCFFCSVSFSLCKIDCLCTCWGHRWPPEKQVKNNLIIYERLQKEQDNCGILPPSQFGIWHGLSSMHAVSHLKKAIKMNVTQIGMFYKCLLIRKRHLNFWIGICWYQSLLKWGSMGTS